MTSCNQLLLVLFLLFTLYRASGHVGQSVKQFSADKKAITIGILHDANWMKKGEFGKIPMDGVLSGLMEFGFKVQVKSFKPQSKAIDFNSKLVVSDAQVHQLKQQDQEHPHQQVNEEDQLMSQPQPQQPPDVKVVLIAVDGQLKPDHLCRQIVTASSDGHEIPDVLMDVTSSVSNFGFKLSSLLQVPLVSSEMVDNFTRRSELTSDSSPFIWFKQPGMLLAESARDVINQFDLAKNILRVLYTPEYRDSANALKNLLMELEYNVRESESMSSVVASSEWTEAVTSSVQLKKNSPERNFALVEFISIDAAFSGSATSDQVNVKQFDLLYQQIRRLRRPKVSSNIVFANTDDIQQLTDAIYSNDLFRSSSPWYFFTKDRSKVKCPSCRHAAMYTVQPQPCHLHEYTGNWQFNVPLGHKVDFYFFYDLTRLLVSSLLQSQHQFTTWTSSPASAWASKMMSKSTSSFQSASAPSVASDDEIAETFCSSHSSPNEKEQVNSEGKSIASNGENESFAPRKMSLVNALLTESKDFYGLFGEFVIGSQRIFSEEGPGASNHNYQDIRFELVKLSYLRDKRFITKLASWFYSEPLGTLISRAYAEGGDDKKEEPVQEKEKAEPPKPEGKTDAEAATTSAPAATGDDKGKDENKGEEKNEEKKDGDKKEEDKKEEDKKEEDKKEEDKKEEDKKEEKDGEGKSEDEDKTDDSDGADSEDAQSCPCLKSNKLTFIVYHHPPFIFVHSESITVNSTLVQVPVQLTDKEKSFSQQYTLDYEPYKSANPKVTVYYTGFLIDLLNAIAEQYQKDYNEKFPDHQVIMSSLFNPKGISSDSSSEGGESGQNIGGFGAKTMKKAGSSGSDDSSNSDGGGNEGAELFKGMVSEVAKCKCMAALMPMTPTPERKLMVKFTEPFFDMVSLSIMMKKPILQYHYWKFVTVLEYSVWICITGAYFFTSLLLWFFDRSSPFSYRNAPEKYKNDVEKRYFSLKESLWFCITSLTPQGGGEAPKALSGRLVAATWWLFGFIVIASYTANLAAFLTVSRLDHPIHNFDELTRQYKTKYAPFEGSATKTYFERMARIEEKFYQVWKDLSLNDDLDEEERAKLAVWDYPISDRFTKIWAAMTEANAYMGYNDAVYKVRSSKSDGREGNALVAETPVIDYATRVHCDLMKIGGEINPRPNAFMYNKAPDGKLKEAFDRMDDIIYKLKDEGKVETLKNKWWYEKFPKKKCYEHRKLYNGITLKNAGGIFIVIAIGVIMTLISLWIENWYYDMKTREDMKKARKDGHNFGSTPRKLKNPLCAIL